MKTKIQLVDRAYSKLRISGLTVDPNPQEITLALDEMECMIAEWDIKNVCLGYNAEEDPDPNTESGLPRGYENAVQTNLAVRLSSEFGKEVPMMLSRQASQSYSALSSATAIVKQSQYPNRQPVGEANTLRFNRWRRYYDIEDSAPNNCQTEIMAKGDITDGKVDYNDYLADDDTIATMTIEATNGLELEHSEFDDTSVSFRVKALQDGTQAVKIAVTTVNGLAKSTCLYYAVVQCKEN